MAGQQQVRVLNQEEYYDRFHTELLRQADLYFLEKRFALETKFNRRKMRHAQMFESILRTDDCEIMSWISKKINGKLGLSDTCGTALDLNVISSSCGDVNITNIINVEADWNSIEW